MNTKQRFLHTVGYFISHFIIISFPFYNTFSIYLNWKSSFKLTVTQAPGAGGVTQAPGKNDATSLQVHLLTIAAAGTVFAFLKAL